MDKFKVEIRCVICHCDLVYAKDVGGKQVAKCKGCGREIPIPEDLAKALGW
jgi:hypothetical protein